LGGLIHFPRTGIRQNDAELHDSADAVLHATRNTSEVSIVTWLDAKRLRDGDDDGDGGGAAA
jgi:hypothetical protein